MVVSGAYGGLNEKSWAGQQVSEGVKGAALGSPVEEGGYRASAASCLSPCRKVSPILVRSNKEQREGKL